MNSFGMCAGGLRNWEKLGLDIYILMMYMLSNVIPLGWNAMLNQYVLLQNWSIAVL